MKNKYYRKCGSRSKNGKRWIIELPIKWVKELQLEEAMMELVLKGNTITIRKVVESKSTDEKIPENSVGTAGDGPTITRY